MGPGQLPAGTGQSVRSRDRGEGHGGNHAVVRFPDQGLHRVQCPGLGLRSDRGRQPVARRRFGSRALCRSHRFREGERRPRQDGARHREVLLRVPRQLRQVLVDPGRGRRGRLVLSQGLVRGSDRDGQLQGQIRLRPGAAGDLAAADGYRRVLLPARCHPAQIRRGDLHRQLLRRHGHGL